MSRSAKAGEGSTEVWGLSYVGCTVRIHGTISLIGGATGSQFDPRKLHIFVSTSLLSV